MEVWQAAKQTGGEIAGSSSRQSNAGGRVFIILAPLPAAVPQNWTSESSGEKGIICWSCVWRDSGFVGFYQVFMKSL